MRSGARRASAYGRISSTSPARRSAGRPVSLAKGTCSPWLRARRVPAFVRAGRRSLPTSFPCVLGVRYHTQLESHTAWRAGMGSRKVTDPRRVVGWLADSQSEKVEVESYRGRVEVQDTRLHRSTSTSTSTSPTLPKPSHSIPSKPQHALSSQNRRVPSENAHPNPPV